MSLSNFASYYREIDSLDPRRYQFAIHGRSEQWANYWRSRRLENEDARADEPDLAATDSRAEPEALTLETIAQHNRLFAAFGELRRCNGHSPGLDGLTYDDFGAADIHMTIREVTREILERSYRPQPHRVVLISYENRQPRQLNLRGVLDRVVSKAILIILDKVIDPVFLRGSYAYRSGRSVHQLLVALDQIATATDVSWFLHDDVRNAFPSIRIGDAIAGFRPYVSDQRLLDLIQVVLQGNEKRQTGLDQGDPLSPLAMNLVLHTASDVPLQEALNGVPRWFRYSDNIAIIGQNAAECERPMSQLTQLLGQRGLDLKKVMPRAINLQRQGARVEFLGFEIRMVDGRVQFGVGSQAWQHLQTNLAAAWEARNPARNAQSVIRGWVMAFGPAFESQQRERYIGEIIRIAVDLGFQEGLSPRGVSRWINAASKKWRELRESESLRVRPGR